MGTDSSSCCTRVPPTSKHSEGEVGAALVEHVLLVADQEHTVAQVAAPAVLGAVDLLVQRKTRVARLLLVRLLCGP